MATAPEPTIGSTISIVASVPASEDQSGYEALSFTEVGKVLSVPELGDDSESGTVTLLKTGRTQHYNGAKIVPPFTIPYVYDLTDAGQVIIRANCNGSTEVTVKVTDADGRDVYIQGVLANLHDIERAPGSYRGETVEFRSITGRTIVTS